jgi:heat shock protein HtpX
LERRPFGRDWGLAFRMGLCLVLLFVLYLPFFAWILGVAYLVSGLKVTVMIGLLAVLALVLVPYLSERLTLSLAGVQPADEIAENRLRPILERLCGLADMPVPRLGVMPTDVPNAFSAGRSPKNAVVVVTPGLLARLDDEELEAVLAHELAHVANRDAFVMTIVAAPCIVGRKVLWGLLSVPFGNRAPGVKVAACIAILYLIPFLLLGWFAYAFATLLVMSITRYREYLADRDAAILTGAPEELQSALQKIAETFTLIPDRDLRDVMGLNAFFVVPAEPEGGGFELDPLRFFPTHPPLDRRLRRLTELARELGRARGVPLETPTVDPLDLRATRKRDNPHAFASFTLALVVWGIYAALFLQEADVTADVLLWIPLLATAAFVGGVVLGLQGVGRASAGASGMGYAVAGLVLLLGPWVLAIGAVVVFGVLAAFGLGPIAVTAPAAPL